MDYGPFSYIVYGPLINGATQVLMYEEHAHLPGRLDRLWQVVDKYQVTQPVHGPDGDPRAHEMEVSTSPSRSTDSLERCASSAPSASRSTRRPGSGTAEVIGGGRTPVVDTWWQTETGQLMISPLPGVTSAKPGSAMKAAAGHLRGGRRRRREAGGSPRGRAAT